MPSAAVVMVRVPSYARMSRAHTFLLVGFEAFTLILALLVPVAYRYRNHGRLSESSWLLIQWLSVVALFALIIWSGAVYRSRRTFSIVGFIIVAVLLIAMLSLRNYIQ